MRLQRNHKKLLGALLLLLYAFISTPVSYWHSHADSGGAHSTLQQPSPGIDNAAADADCKICSHHYAVADAGSPTPDVLFASASSTYSLSLYLSILSPKSYCQSNRGPPVLV